ncbi:hypothetical protein ACO2FJ_12740 [Staphylococcus warneri]
MTKDDLKQPLELMPRPYDANISIVVKAREQVLYILEQSIKGGLVQQDGPIYNGVNAYNDENGEFYIISILVI